MIRSAVGYHSPSFAEKLQAFQALVRTGALEQAANLLAAEARMSREWAHSQVEREAKFLRTVDASVAIGTRSSQDGLSPRQGLIMAAVVGWRGDDTCSWPSPVDRETLLAWGESHCQGPADDLKIALDALVLQGLFFDIHPAVFAATCYYCTFDPEFLEENPTGNNYRDLWRSMGEEYDQKYGLTWRHTGLCAGQGSQGPSDARWGPCLGTCCVCFRSGNKKCNWELEFNPAIRPAMLSD